MTKTDGTSLDEKYFTAVTNTFIHSMFSRYTITLNATTINQAADLYEYRAYLENLLAYGTDAATSHLTNAFWYLDYGNTLPNDPTKTDSKNKGFITRWNRIKQSKEFQLYGRLHSDVCNATQHLISGVKLKIKIYESRNNFLPNEYKRRIENVLSISRSATDCQSSQAEPCVSYGAQYDSEQGGRCDIEPDESRNQDIQLF